MDVRDTRCSMTPYSNSMWVFMCLFFSLRAETESVKCPQMPLPNASYVKCLKTLEKWFSRVKTLRCWHKAAKRGVEGRWSVVECSRGGIRGAANGTDNAKLQMNVNEQLIFSVLFSSCFSFFFFFCSFEMSFRASLAICLPQKAAPADAWKKVLKCRWWWWRQPDWKIELPKRALKVETILQ